MRRRACGTSKGWLLVGNAILGVALLAGCDTASPTAPTASDLRPSIATVGPVRFEYDAGVTEPDKATLEASARIASDYFQRQFQRTVAGPVTVSVRNTDGPFAVSGPKGSTLVTVYVGHRNWQIHGPWKRTRMMVHELYEILQEEVHWPGDWDTWLQEGSAEFVGDAATIAAGMATIDELRQCQISIYFFMNGPSAVSLDRLFEAGADPANVRHVIAWLAWDRLLGGPAGASRIAAYWSGGFPWAFGRTEQSFLGEFEQYRRALQAPDSGVCASLDWR
jgi:hypothetical protein